MTFTEFNFRPELAKAIETAGFKEPSPILRQHRIQHRIFGKRLPGCDDRAARRV
jgi:superfamily II DNA/RNA helicase